MSVADHSHLRNAFNEMLNELYQYNLEVCLVPSRYREYAIRGAKIRSVVNCNPNWYKKLCNKYQSSRTRRSAKSDTCIKRQNIIRILERLANGFNSSSYYVDDLVKVAESINIEQSKILEDPPF
jgi:hypothetical protein